MSLSVQLDRRLNQFYFEEFPTTPVAYQEEVFQTDSSFINLEVTDVQTREVLSVSVKESELKGIGIPPKIWKLLEHMPDKLPELIQTASSIEKFLGMSLPLVSKNLSSEYQIFFNNIPCANRIIVRSIYRDVKHLSGVVGIPGMYFHRGVNLKLHIFINLKKTPPLGTGAFGKVRKVLWLTGLPAEVVAKKVFDKASSEEDDFEHTQLHFREEFAALQVFSNKRGIISLIAGGIYNQKYAFFLPMYACNLQEHLNNHPYGLSLDDKLNVTSQWLEGLATIAEKGIHGDLSPNNLLLRRRNKEVEAVISDFGTFRLYDKKEHGLSHIYYAPPEYHERELVTSKQDVWALGLSLWGLFSNQQLFVLGLISKLVPGWLSKHPMDPTKTPLFVMELIEGMLDPRVDHRLSAKDAFEQFSEGWANKNSS